MQRTPALQCLSICEDLKIIDIEYADLDDKNDFLIIENFEQKFFFIL